MLHSEHDLERVFAGLCHLKLDYILMEPVYCYGRLGHCRMVDIWRLEDNRTNYWYKTTGNVEPNRNGQPLCHKILDSFRFDKSNANPFSSYFKLIASNDQFYLFQLVNCNLFKFAWFINNALSNPNGFSFHFVFLLFTLQLALLPLTCIETYN